MEKERIIVSLTTWEKRICNIPTVLDTIFSQTLPPNLVVLNLNADIKIPNPVMQYITDHRVEVNYVDYQKVYKKIIPTLFKYPDDCIINIDDDWLYPPTMIEDFWTTHKKYPDYPISGNREFVNGLPCHCGCASLTKMSFFNNLDVIDQDLMEHCQSDDAVFTFLAAKSERHYVWTQDTYYLNMMPFNPQTPYTISDHIVNTIGISWDYLVSRFGTVPSLVDFIVKDDMMRNIWEKKYQLDKSSYIVEGQRMVRSSMAYKVGNFILKPFGWLIHHK